MTARIRHIRTVSDMREILFRGKTYDGKWVEGSLHIEYGETTRDGKRNIDYRILGMRGECHYIIPETVGQYIGLPDNNGKKIFEGDIIRRTWLGERTYQVTFDDRTGAFIGKTKDDFFTTFDDDGDEFEVIGNIHDNPELLKGGAK